MNHLIMSTTNRRSRRTTVRNRPIAVAPTSPTKTEPTALAKGSSRVPTLGVESLTRAVDLTYQVERELRARPSSIDDLCGRLDAEPSRVSAAIRAMRLSGLDVVNIGSEDRPWWWVRPGDDCAAGVLVEAVLALISWRPLTMGELQDLTGARRNRISGAIVRLKERMRDRDEVNPPNILNLGSKSVARWYAGKGSE